MRIIVLGGCGAMGSEATRDLATTSDFEEIVIADADLPRAQALAAELGGGRVRAIHADANDEGALTESLLGFDVVANCTVYHFGLTVTRAAIKAGTSIAGADSRVGQSERGRWLLFDEFHPRNVTASYKELEWE